MTTLKKGDEIRVIAPARSLTTTWIAEEVKNLATKRFADLGFKLSFGKHVNEIDDFSSSSIDSRIEDIHDAFADQNVKMIITVIGGFNSNQLLRYLNYELIKNNPKIFCGFSDITVLANAIYAKTGMVTYSGSHFLNFGDKNEKSFNYIWEYFKKCLCEDLSFEVLPSQEWSNDGFACDQSKRIFVKNEGYWLINEGEAEGISLGGNQCSLNLLQGTEFMPNLANSILFLEDDEEAHVATFDRDLQSIIHLPDFAKVRGIVIGRFRNQSGMNEDLLKKIIKSKKELDLIPVIANADFGHTTPFFTFPIGGLVRLSAKKDRIKLEILQS